MTSIARAVLVFATLVAFATAEAHHGGPHYRIGRHGWKLPDPAYTIGVPARPAPSLEALCTPGYTTTVRNVPTRIVNLVCAAYGMPWHCSKPAPRGAMIRTLPHRVAGSTQPSPITSEPRVLFIERVPARAMRPPGLFGYQARATSDILSVGYRFEMIGVYAPGISAQVVEFQANWYTSLEVLIDQDVSAPLAESTVASALHLSAEPIPASSGGILIEAVKVGAGAGHGTDPHSRRSFNACPDGCEIDHLCALAHGCTNRDPREPDETLSYLRELWPQPWAEARLKDRLEVKLYRMVCAREITMAEAIRAITTDWTVAYDRYVRGKE